MRGYRDNHIKEDTMRNKRLLAISAIAISASVFMTACSFGGDGKTDKTETVEVTNTPTPEVTPSTDRDTGTDDRTKCTEYNLYISR